MARRFVNFVNTIRKSSKVALRSLLKVIEHDTRSVTGHNLRMIWLKSDAAHIHSLKPSDVSYDYKEFPAEEKFRVNLIKELIEVKQNKLEVPGFSLDEVDELLQHVCVS